MTPTESAKRLHAKLFAPECGRAPRSRPYKNGALAGLMIRVTKPYQTNPHQPGTADSDAWYAGQMEGIHGAITACGIATDDKADDQWPQDTRRQRYASREMLAALQLIVDQGLLDPRESVSRDAITIVTDAINAATGATP